MVKIIFTGTGHPILQRLDDVKACASEAVLVGDDILLFDCGRHVSSQLLRSGVPPYNVNYLFFTHIFHFDHTCDYPNLLFSRWGKASKKLSVFGPEGTVEFTNNVIKSFIDGRGLRIMENVSIRDVYEGFVHRTEQWEIECVNTTHGPNFNQFSLAYKINTKGKSIVVSGDITIPSEEGHRYGNNAYSFNDKLVALAKDADIFIMDACLVHTTPEDLARAAIKANAKKVVITHMHEPGFRSQRYQRVQLDYDDLTAEINKIFRGEIIVAEDLKSITI